MKKYLTKNTKCVEANAANAKLRTAEDNEVNYEAFKKRAPEIFSKENTKAKVANILNDADYVKRRFENPYKYYTVENSKSLQLPSTHEEELVERMIKTGEIVPRKNKKINVCRSNLLKG